MEFLASVAGIAATAGDVSGSEGSIYLRQTTNPTLSTFAGQADCQAPAVGRRSTVVQADGTPALPAVPRENTWLDRQGDGASRRLAGWDLR